MAASGKPSLVWWYVLLLALSLELVNPLINPFSGYWRDLLGTQAYVNSFLALGGLTPFMTCLALVMLYLKHRSRLPGISRAVALVTLVLLGTTAAIGAASSVYLIVTSPSSRSAPVAYVWGLLLIPSIAMDVIAKLLTGAVLLYLAVAARRSAHAPRTISLLVVPLGLLIAADGLHSLPMAWRVLDIKLGLPAWTEPPSWLERHRLFGFRAARFVELGTTAMKLALVAAFIIVSGAWRGRGIFAVPGFCQFCRYDLTGIPETVVCPECGKSVSSHQRIDVTRPRSAFSAPPR